MQNDEPPPLATRIASVYAALSRQERQLADAVLEHVRDLPGYTATELATQAKVSKATATRFFRRLGYEGFEAARLEARGSSYAGSPLESLEPERRGAADDTLVGTHLTTEARNLAETLGAISTEDLVSAVELLARARKIWVVGFRDSYALALYARAMLSRIMENVALLPGDGASYAEDLIGLGTADAVLAIGFRRRPHMFGTILKLAEAARAPVVLLAEPDARIRGLPKTVFFRCRSVGSVFDSHAAALSVLNLLCSRIVRELGSVAKARLEAAERTHEILKDLPVVLPR